LELDVSSPGFQNRPAFWLRANTYFESCGITVKRVLTDNGSCYRSHAFKDALGPDIKHKRTRPYRPQTNGKVERYNRTMLDEWVTSKIGYLKRMGVTALWISPVLRQRKGVDDYHGYGTSAKTEHPRTGPAGACPWA
jgi:transposase InsO family protein